MYQNSDAGSPPVTIRRAPRWPMPGVVLLLEHSGKLRRGATADFKRAMEVLQGACREWAGRGVPFWAFVALPDAEFEAL